MRRLQRKHLFFIRGHRCKVSPVPCCFTSSLATQTKTSLSTCLQITRRWYDYYSSVIIKPPDRDPKSYSIVDLVLKRQSSLSPSTKTPLPPIPLRHKIPSS